MLTRCHNITKDITSCFDLFNISEKGLFGNLLTMTGSIALKSICFLNLNLEANSAAENNLLKEFIDDAKEVG